MARSSRYSPIFDFDHRLLWRAIVRFSPWKNHPTSKRRGSHQNLFFLLESGVHNVFETSVFGGLVSMVINWKTAFVLRRFRLCDAWGRLLFFRFYGENRASRHSYDGFSMILGAEMRNGGPGLVWSSPSRVLHLDQTSRFSPEMRTGLVRTGAILPS